MDILDRRRAVTRKPQALRLSRHHPYAYGLVGCWLFGERGGASIRDLSGREHHGTFSGAVSRRVNQAGPTLSTPGGSNFAEVPDSDDWQLTNGSIVMRVRFNNAGTASCNSVLSQDEIPGTSIPKWFFGYGGVIGTPHSQTKTQFFHQPDPGNADEVLSSSWTIDTKRFYTIGLTKSGLNYTFYLDGVPNGTAVGAFATANVAATLRMGFAESGGFDFAGELEYVRFYNRVLSADLMARIHARPYDDLLRPDPMRFVLRHVEPPAPPDVFRDATFPLEVLGGVGRDTVFPLEVLGGMYRDATFPLETILTPPLTLRDTWNVTIPLELRFTDSWNVLGEAQAGFTLRDQWNVGEGLPAFRDRWNVSEDLRVLASQTVQRPTVTVDKS